MGCLRSILGNAILFVDLYVIWVLNSALFVVDTQFKVRYHELSARVFWDWAGPAGMWGRY